MHRETECMEVEKKSVYLNGLSSGCILIFSTF